MTHQDSLEQMAVERYLLGELTGDARDQFEEHLFDCQECASDLKDGLVFIDAAKVELKTQRAPESTAVLTLRRPSRLTWLWQPWVLAPALAACLMVIVYQTAVLVPRMRTQLAESQAPAVLQSLVLANAGARGDSVPEIVAPRHGYYLLSVDIPPAANVSGYRCSLYSLAGAVVWHVDVAPGQVRDAVMIQVPVMTAHEGMNELHVQGIASYPGTGDTLVDLATYRYKLSFGK
jgi:hypothetical protein